jgi:MoaA/NifB/PqqE/SkfB family radical SAM enzyme
MNYAKELKLNICLNVVFFSDNADEVRMLIDFSRKEHVFLVLNIASPEGKLQGSDALRLQQKDMAIFDEFMLSPNVRHDSSVNFSGRRECPAGKERIHITAYGDVLTCPLVQISYGNVLEEPLKDIYKRMCAMDHIKRYSAMCKHAFDQKYYEEFLLPISKEGKRPVSVFDHPACRRSADSIYPSERKT